MTAKFYYRTSAGATVEITDRIDRRVPWELKETAEEGAVPMSTIVVADPDMDFDLDGHRAFMVLESESEITDDVLFGGWTWNQTVSRGEGDNFEPLGRTWNLEVTDRNAFWQRRVMVGADCKRPAETDVQRMAWLLSTSEAGIFDDVSTYVLGTGGTNLDKCDYRGQYLGQVVDDCSQASGRNWYAWLEYDGTTREMIAWYNRDSVTARTSTLSLSNDPTDWLDEELLDGTSIVWPISEDTRLTRDASRVYSGVYLSYDGGAVYRRDSATATAFASRDFVAPSSNVKTNAKAAARATRYLNELDAQDDRITTTVELPKAKGTMIRAGMRIPFKATHLPGYGTFQWLRVLSCSITPAAGGERYRLTLELAPNGNGEYTPPYTGATFASIIRSESYTGALGFAATMDAPPAGWDLQAAVGPIAIDQAVAPFSSITVSAAMTVRCTLVAAFSQVAEGSQSIVLNLTVNGVVIGSDASYYNAGLGYWTDTLLIDVRDVVLAADDVVGFTTATTAGAGWTNFTANVTFLRVGRGTFVWENGSFEGP